MKSYTDEEIELIEKHRRGSRAIWWSIDDFEMEAQGLEENGEGPFDRSKFQEALDDMIGWHDANSGVCWEDLKYNLREYCKL